MNRLNWKERVQSWQGANPVERNLDAYRTLANAISREEVELVHETDASLKERLDHLRMRAASGDSLEALQVEFFAVGREAAYRTLEMCPFDVQIMAGLALFDGKLIEMKTGEGKTLAAVLPACLHALSGKGVHILTFNNYLARRDAQWMKPLYDFMGVSVGFIQEGQSIPERQEAYSADVTYATAKEAGFDFLRMHLARSPENCTHCGFHYAIVDEADSILIDEARVPLVIAGERLTSDADPYRVAAVVHELEAAIDWETDEYKRNVLLTERGTDRVERALQCGNLHADENYLLLTEVNQALHACVLLKRDVDYIVRDERIEIVDEFTGRVMKDRRWPDGLQAALEAKEGLPIQHGGRVLGSIPLQYFLKRYSRLAGMTATAQSSAEEIDDFYGLKTVPIPSNRPCIREDLPSLIFTHREAKHRAIVNTIDACHRRGRPVLVGTSSVAESELLAERLQRLRIPCEVLNAKNDEVEASIIARAGEPGAVTISTNLAGRGTDIKLGGIDESRRDEVVDLGGLLVIGTNLHESKRIDDQLRGRAGRQGDPGASQLYLSLEDELLVRFGIDDLIPQSLRPPNQYTPLAIPFIRMEVEHIQRVVEGQNFEIRKTLLKYSKVLEEQRKELYTWRTQVLKFSAQLDIFRRKVPESYSTAAELLGEPAVYDLERIVTLHHIDMCWAEHLDHVNHLREGIHLVGIGGLNPINEFHKQLIEAFRELHAEIEERIINTLKELEISEKGASLDPTLLQGPSSTWTYLINDRVQTDLQNSLFGYGSSAFVAGAALMTWPLLLGWGIWQRWKQKG